MLYGYIQVIFQNTESKPLKYNLGPQAVAEVLTPECKTIKTFRWAGHTENQTFSLIGLEKLGLTQLNSQHRCSYWSIFYIFVTQNIKQSVTFRLEGHIW